MRNEVMFQDKNSLNSFTEHLAEKCEVNGFVRVELRNNTFVDVCLTMTGGCFHTSDWSHCWNLDGSSVTSKNFDICFTA